MNDSEMKLYCFLLESGNVERLSINFGQITQSFLWTEDIYPGYNHRKCLSGEKQMADIIAGLAAEVEHIVDEADTASKWGSGLVPVFSTPALVGLMESAAVKALEGHMVPGQTTVGSHIDVHHLSATPRGMKVRARAVLNTVEKRRLVFRIQAWDEVELIGEADHERILVDEARFLTKVQLKNEGK
jgi:fluoroacetyl-CoA thioesterase